MKAQIIKEKSYTTRKRMSSATMYDEYQADVKVYVPKKIYSKVIDPRYVPKGKDKFGNYIILDMFGKMKTKMFIKGLALGVPFADMYRARYYRDKMSSLINKKSKR